MRMERRETKWMVLQEIPNEGKKTRIFQILTKDEVAFVLGYIKWYGPWRQYTFQPEGGTVFEHQCLQDIRAFLVHLMEVRKLDKQILTNKTEAI